MTATIPDWPAALRLDQAAAYVGLSVETFKKVCPVKPIEFTPHPRGYRYRTASLDSWLADRDPNKAGSPRRRFGERLNGDQGAT